MSVQFITADCLDWLREQPDDSVDLVFCSPPYEAARTYGIGFKLRGQEWVDWCVVRFVECLRVCRGLVCWNVEGQTRNYRYSATPLLLAADLHRAGVHLRKPPIFQRVGIPGSGGPDWLRNDYEFLICGTKGGRLPWSDNTACGHTPKWAPGGEMSHRTPSGERRDKWGGTGHATGGEGRHANGQRKSRPSRQGLEPKVACALANGLPPGAKLHTKHNGVEMRQQLYVPPAKANPGNVITCKVGGGLMGHKMAHENEAPFPLKLAEFFVRSFCPPDGTVLDVFGGSGTTAHAAVIHGRKAIAVDIRESQTELQRQRIEDVLANPRTEKRTKKRRRSKSQGVLFSE